ncbi:uncharacterized protein PG986_011624 [Apiospora aurea]|uniref:Uncharacterized protein n=1 Tax=Apiospora aurea TaxID=335848 RepID=A0ABR1PXQ4_9PEZI
MEPYEHRQDALGHAVEDLLDTALASQLQPKIESPSRTISVFLCHWDSDAETYPEIDSGIHALQKTFEHQYGFSTEVHELEQAKSSSKNQLTLMSRFLPLLYDTSPDPMMPCRCLEGMHRYLHKPEEVNLFIFIYLGFAETASDGSCLLRPVGQPDQDPASLPSVNYSSVSRATTDMGESQVLALLGCPYDGPSASATSANKELIAAGSALWTPAFEFTTHLVHHIRRAARDRRVLNTPLLFARLASTLSSPPIRRIGAAVGGGTSSQTPSLGVRGIGEGGPPRIRPSSQTGEDVDGTRVITLRASVWYCLPASPLVTLIRVEKTAESEEEEATAALPSRPRRKKKGVCPQQSDEEEEDKKSFPDPQKPKIRLDEKSKSGLRSLLQGLGREE